jgi:hypothetical protein
MEMFAKAHRPSLMVYRILYEMIAKEHLLGNPLVPEKDFVVPK